jgi:hypothetical protein
MVLMTLVLPVLGACAAPPSASSEGGMDGAGTLGLGLRLDAGIFFQGVWSEGAITYVVLNERAEDVDLTFSECVEGGALGGCTFGTTIATWRLPPRSMKKFVGSEALVLSGASELVGGSANGQNLGLLVREVAPFSSERAVVSNAEINSSSGGRENAGQVETDFLVAPAAEFVLELALPVRGVLTLSSRTDPVEGLPFLDVLGARSDSATVSVTESGLSVQVPDTASVASPVRVAVDVRYPDGFAGKLVGFDAWFCLEGTQSGQCHTGQRIQRAIPAESPSL